MIRNSFREAPLAKSFVRKASDPYEKEGRHLTEWENEDLSLPEMKRKLESLEEEGGQEELIGIMKRDISRREKRKAQSEDKVRQVSDIPKSFADEPKKPFPRWDVNPQGKFNPSTFQSELSSLLQERFKVDDGTANGMARAALEILEKQKVLNKSSSAQRYQD